MWLRSRKRLLFTQNIDFIEFLFLLVGRSVCKRILLCFRRVSGVWLETMVSVAVGLVRGVARARHFVQWGWGRAQLERINGCVHDKSA